MLENESCSVAVKVLIDLFNLIVAFSVFNLKTLSYIDYIKKELSKYCRLEQYSDYADIKDVKKYIKTIIDDSNSILVNLKSETLKKDGKEITYVDYIMQLSVEQQQVLLQILPKFHNEKLIYTDLIKLKQIIDTHKRQGSLGSELDGISLLEDYSEELEYINAMQMFIEQKKEDLALLENASSLDVVEKRKENLKKEITLSYAEKARMKYIEDKIAKLKDKLEHADNSDTRVKIDNEIKKHEAELQVLKYLEVAVEDAIYNSNFEILYLPIRKNNQKTDVEDENSASIVTPISADTYKIRTEKDGIIHAIYAGKSEYATSTYYRTVAGHFYNQNGQEEKPRLLYNSDGTLKAEIQYDSEESGQRILKEIIFLKDERKIPNTITYYQYDVNGVYRGKYTEVFDNNKNLIESCYYNQFGSPCKCEKEYVVKGIRYKDVFGYIDGKIKDTPNATYMLDKTNWKKTTKPSVE